jgi:hypothetical protein
MDRLLQGQLAWLKDTTSLSVLKLEGIEFKDLKFPNEESYRGGWKDSRVRPTAGHRRRRHLCRRTRLGCAVHHCWSGKPSMPSDFPTCPATCSLREKAATPGPMAAHTRVLGTRA